MKNNQVGILKVLESLVIANSNGLGFEIEIINEPGDPWYYGLTHTSIPGEVRISAFIKEGESNVTFNAKVVVNRDPKLTTREVHAILDSVLGLMDEFKGGLFRFDEQMNEYTQDDSLLSWFECFGTYKPEEAVSRVSSFFHVLGQGS